MALAAAVGGGFAGCHPTGTELIDPLYAAVFAALLTLAASRSGRAPVLVLAAVAVGLSRGWLLLPAAVALVVAFSAVFMRRQRQRIGAFIGALSAQALLRWPSVGFHGLTALVAGVVAAICLLSAYRHLSSKGRRWARRSVLGLTVVLIVCSVPVAVAAFLSRTPVDHGIAETDSAISSLVGGSSTISVNRLSTAGSDFATASDRANSWWSSEGLLVPVVAQQRRAVAGAAEAGHAVTTGAAQAARGIDLRHLGYSNGRFNLAQIRALATPLQHLRVDLDTARSQLRSVQSSWLLSPVGDRIASMGTRLSRIAGRATEASHLVNIAPSLLGASGRQRYFIAFMTPSESRGLDGFIGAYGEISVDRGRITLVKSGSVTQLNQVPSGKRHISGPADYLARYGNFHPQNNFQDLTYSPDFPTDAQVIAQMYPQSGGSPVNGVLALDPEALGALLELTGPVNVPGLSTPLTAADASSFLLSGEYLKFGAANVARHDFLQEALGGAFEKLVSQRMPSLAVVERYLTPVVDENRLLFWSSRSTDEAVLRTMSIGGAFPKAHGGDLLAVTTQNAANNKIDYYLHRTITDQVRFNPASGETVSTVTLRLQNDAPTTGLPKIVGGSYAGSGLPVGTNRAWVSVYSPLGLVAATQSGTSTTMSSTPELGVNAYSAYVNIPAGGSVTLRLHLTGTLRPSTTYRITVHRQPLVNPDAIAVEVEPSAGWKRGHSTALSPTGGADQEESVRFSRFS